jgi:suppressor of G2 allele of SKP1
MGIKKPKRAREKFHHFLMSSSLKSDWYQTDTNVIITILVKNMSKENVVVDLHERDLLLTVKMDGSREVQLNWTLLHNATLIEYKVFSTKIEIQLSKEVGQRWDSLEPKNDPETTISYPTSSKKVYLIY